MRQAHFLESHARPSRSPAVRRRDVLRRRLENLPIRLKLLLALSFVGLLPMIVLSLVEIIHHGGRPPPSGVSLPSLFLSLELVLALLCVGWLAQMLIRPLRELQRHAEALLEEKQVPIDLERGDEIGHMARAFARLLAQRQRAEDSLRESEERLRIIFERAGVGIGQTNQEGRFVLVNPKMCDLLGYTAREFQALTWLQLTHPEDLPPSLTQARGLEQPGAPVASLQKRFVRKDGAVVWANRTLVALRNAAGRVVGFITVLQDITEQKRAEEERARLYQEAQEAIRARDVFLSVASHELKTPLTSLQLCLQQGLRGLHRLEPFPPQCDRVLTQLGLAERQARRLGTLINELLDVSRLSAPGFTLHLAPVDLTELARSVVAREEEKATRVGSTLVLHAPGPVMGRWDGVRLEQVLLNLLSNAIKFGRGRPIEVKVEADAEQARLAVRDQGIGISPEAQSRIFDRFERAVPERHYGGLGLGLWLARQIVEAHGGAVQVESAEGQGATFLVRLPRAGPPG